MVGKAGGVGREAVGRPVEGVFELAHREGVGHGKVVTQLVLEVHDGLRGPVVGLTLDEDDQVRAAQFALEVALLSLEAIDHGWFPTVQADGGFVVFVFLAVAD